ncbi:MULTISPECIES: hypothetical protein [unclassified Haloarcula]|uniref:hypothetical protein n=1 Tax=unclassified Haloarcula TaxID=2624677 RepID=UPI00067955C4|nr:MULTISPECIES: hypothetical protein [unclassified Haloarcula]
MTSKLLTTLAVALVVLAGIPAGSIGAVAADSGPSGMSAVPDGNIDVDVPDGQTPAIPAESLRGATYAGSNASSMSVTVTTPDRAEDLVGLNANLIGAGDLALILGDDQHHAGREVALPAGAVHEQLGYTPKQVRGVHSSGSTWTREVAYENGYLVFEVPEFSENGITFSGEVQITASPATDGFISAYGVGDKDAVNDFTADVTGITNTETDTESASSLTDGDTLSLSVAGNLPPTGPSTNNEPEIVFEGTEKKTEWSASATSSSSGSTKSVSVPGNVDPSSESVEFVGNEQTTARTVSGSSLASGDTLSYNVGGNIPATGAEVTFTGGLSSTSTSASGTGSGSVSVGGNIDAVDEGVSVTGRESTSSASASGSLSPGNSESLNLNGNLDPTNEQLTVTAGQSVSQGVDNYQYAILDDNAKLQSEFSLEPTPSEPITSLKLPNDAAGDGSGKADIYLVREGVDTTQKEGTLVASDVQFTTSNEEVDIDAWDPNGASEVTVEIVQTSLASTTITVGRSDGTDAADGKVYGHADDSPSDSTATATYRTGADVTVEAADTGASKSFSVGGGNSETKSFSVNRADTISASGSGSFDYTLDYTAHTGTEDPSVDVDGDGSAEASWSGVYTSGETPSSKSVDGLSPGTNSISTETTNGPQPDWTLSWTERTATEDPSIDVDGDGSTDASYTGVLKSGETHTASVSDLPTGSHTASVSTGHKVDVDIDMTERTATEDPGLDLDGDGATDASYSGILTSGQSMSVSAETLSNGDSTVETSLTAGTVDYTISADGTYHTEDPAVDVDGDGVTEAGYSGMLAPGETATAELPSIDRQTSDVKISTVGGSATTAQVTYTERTETEDVSLYVNGNETSYAGRLGDGETTSLTTDSAWVREGTNNVTLGLAQQSADAPATQVQLTYRHEVQDKQTVTYTAEQLTSRYNVSKSFAGDRSAASLTIPFERNVYEVRNLEVRTNGGTWSEVAPADYELNDTTLNVELGSVSAGDTVTVRADGSMARVNNGSIQVVDPSVRGSTLDSRVKLTDWNGDSYMRLPDGAERIHYAYDEPWADESGEYATVEANGTQRLYLPPSDAGYEFQLATVPVTATPTNGDVQISVTDAPDTNEPSLEIGAGSTYGDEVEFTFVDAKDDQKYILYSTSQGVVRDSGTANSPLTLSDDDSDETLQFQEENTTSSATDSTSGPFNGPTMGPITAPEEGIPIPLIVGVVLLLALAVLVRRFEFITLPSAVPEGTLPAAAAVLVVVYIIDWASGHVITQSLGSGLQPLVPLAGLIGLLLTAYYLYKTYIKGQGPRPIQIVSNGASRVRDGSNRLRGGNN